MKQPDTIREDTIANYHNALKFIESQLKSRGTKFLDGSEPGYADYMIWPWFERLLTVDDEKYKLDGNKFALLVRK